MPSIDEINNTLDELEPEFPVQPFKDKWRRLLYPIYPMSLERVPVPAGTFRMGSNHIHNAFPVHDVTLSAFRISKHPVTFKQWNSVVNWAEKNGYIFFNKGRMGAGVNTNENHPVTQISWYDSVLWCNALSEKEGREPCYYLDQDKSLVYRRGQIHKPILNWKHNGYRLPGEAEWEYACRAWTTSEYAYGADITGHQANFGNNEKGTKLAGRYEPNKWGIYDMHGNVWEWCWDLYNPGYYRKGKVKNPEGPSQGSLRVIRGGSWNTVASRLRSANREALRPDIARDDIGFRPVCKAE